MIPPFREDEVTKTGLPRAGTPARVLRVAPVVPSDPPAADQLPELVGQLMAVCASLQTTCTALQASCSALDTKIAALATLPSEVSALRRDVDEDRKDLVHDSSKSAATHTSNRMAALLGALFTVYEIASPYFHGIWSMFHK